MVECFILKSSHATIHHFIHFYKTTMFIFTLLLFLCRFLSPRQCGGAGEYPCRSRPARRAAWLANTRPARSPRALSNCWCWLLTANRFTCTGIGTTSLLLFDCVPLGWWGPAPRPALTRFHLARRFWNQIFTWTSLRRNADAIWLRSVRDKYFLAWNSRSSSKSCSLVKAVRRRRALVDPGPSQGLSDFWVVSSVSSSMSETEKKWLLCTENWR